MPTSACILALVLTAIGPGASASASASTSGPADASASSKRSRGSGDWWHRHLPENHMLELGVWAGILIPNGRHELYDPRVASQVHYGVVAPDFGLRFAYLPLRFLGAEIEGGMMPTRTETDRFALLYTVRGHAIGQLPFWRLAPFLLVGGGAMGVSSASSAQGDDIDRSFHWGPGAKLFLNEWLAVRLDLRHLVGARRGVDAGATSHFEVLAGLSVTFRLAKSDDDDRDAGDESDPDGDGYRGEDDECPDQTGIYPDGCPAPDKDSDTVADESDACPDQPGDKPDGCPPDSDGDGVRDPEDECIDQAGDAPDGCPPDADEDGIADVDDECKQKPETQNGYEDEDGCPDELPQRLRGAAGTMPGITFEVNSATITPESRPALDAAVTTLKENPKYVVKIEGHTDSTGSRDHNIELSQQRADAVKRYLVDHGVAAERITTQGRGPDRPVADNDTEAGRRDNRRIEFKLRRGRAKKGQGE